MKTPDSAPHWRRNVRTLAGLFGAPLVWILQMSISEPLAENSCIGHSALAGLWQSLPLALKLFSFLCVATGLLSGLAAHRMWDDAAEQEAGDGRRRFMARLALMSSFLFIVAIIFTACAAFLVTPCQSH